VKVRSGRHQLVSGGGGVRKIDDRRLPAWATYRRS